MTNITKKISLGAIALLCAVGANAQVPTVEAPTPPYDDANVKSIISDKYEEPVGYLQLLEGYWGTLAKYSFVEIGDEGSALQILDLGAGVVEPDPAKSSGGWLAIPFPSAVNLRDMEYVHFDLYCNENTSFRLGFQNSYPNDNTGEYYSSFVQYTTPGQWASYYYPVSDLIDAGLQEVGLGSILYLRIGYGHNQNDFPRDGSIVYSNEIYLNNVYVFNGDPDATGIKTVTNDGLVKIYPTAVRENLTLQSTESIAKATIYNIDGRQVASFNVNAANKTLNLSALSAGSYIVSVKTADGTVSAQRIIKL